MSLQKQLNNLISRKKIILSRKENLFFLVEEWEIEKLIELLELKEKDCVAVIRSNAGLLAQELKGYDTIIFEPFQRIAEAIEDEFSRENLQIVNEAFLKTETKRKFNKVIAVQQPDKKTLFKLLREEFEVAILLVHERFAEKLLAKEGFMDYNEVSVLTQYYCEAEEAGSISPASFFPKASSPVKIIKLSKKKQERKAKQEKEFEEFIKHLFRFKNKNIENALKNSLKALGKKFEKEKIAVTLKKQKITKEKVGLLSVEELVELFNEVF